jgi:hypothetical protein
MKASGLQKRKNKEISCYEEGWMFSFEGGGFSFMEKYIANFNQKINNFCQP